MSDAAIRDEASWATGHGPLIFLACSAHQTVRDSAWSMERGEPLRILLSHQAVDNLDNLFAVGF